MKTNLVLGRQTKSFKFKVNQMKMMKEGKIISKNVYLFSLSFLFISFSMVQIWPPLHSIFSIYIYHSLIFSSNFPTI